MDKEMHEFKGYVGAHLENIIKNQDKMNDKLVSMCGTNATERQKLEDHLKGHNRAWVYLSVLTAVISSSISIIGLVIMA